jgi:DDHD domain
VNWRLTLSFEDGGYRDESSTDVTNDYTLKDITPSTLPSVRNIVSDVMLDIPYYLTPGYHDKMVAAVVCEANRVYQLWCANNPLFAEHGKVHLLAHSLGSIMAVDILSSQPTTISLSKPITSLALSDLPSAHFAFNVSTLFLAGSPTGFFLLLKNSSLLPRRGHRKPGGESDVDATPGVTGEEGTYGCLPVDNVYNIVNPYDPVAYCLNAAVDADYAASLKPATLPSAKQAWLPSFSLRSSAPPVANAASAILKPGAARLPSTVEMETHDFSREEIAERKAYALNDNGQIDFFLRYGGGPLEIQYLTMLGAHSSYWISRDFLRMLVCEIGRPPGREGTLEGMRAVKKKRGKKS